MKRTITTTMSTALVMTLCAGMLACEGDPGGAYADLDGIARDGTLAQHTKALTSEGDVGNGPISGGIGALVLADGEVLELKRVEVDAKASAGMAALTITHTFHNPLAQQLEGTFRFTVPAGAIVTGLRMETDGKWVAGEIVGRRKAERVYRKIVDSMRDPAILKWQGGGRLELRIFPIPAQTDKRLALDLLVPLQRPSEQDAGGQEAGPGGGLLRYGLSGEPGAVMDTVPIDQVVLRVNGREVFSARDVDRGRVVPLRFEAPATPANQPVVWLEQPTGADGRRFLATQLTLPAPPPVQGGGARTVVVLVDRSRSALGATALQEHVVQAVLNAGAADDHFIVAATDITCRPHPAGFVATDGYRIDETMAWLRTVEPDGASDLSEALRCAKRLLTDAPAGRAQVVLVHDGVATWGELDDKALLTLAESVPAPIFSAAVGRATAIDTLHGLAQVRGGRTFVPRRVQDATVVGQTIAGAPWQSRWRDVRVTIDGQPFAPTTREQRAKSTSPRQRAVSTTLGSGPTAVIVAAVEARTSPQATTPDATEKAPMATPLPEMARALPHRLGTVFHGQRPWIVVEVPQGVALPSHLDVHAAGQKNPWRLPLADVQDGSTALPGHGLRQRFGTHAVAAMQAAGLPKKPIIAASRTYGVLSKHTALLVLESEEAYARHGIERANKAANRAASQGGPRVSGADLESLHGGPSVSPDRIQPGDPEVRVPAPRDARSVTIELPWGERLRAKWEPDSDHGKAAWVARFLVDLAVPEGRYPLQITIVHADGHATHQQLTLTIDTTAPSIRISVVRHPRRKGLFIIRARQLAPHAALDARGVEVRLPDGQVIPLKALRLGVFVARWRPTQALTWPLKMEVFAIDRALNQRSAVVHISKPGRSAAMGKGRQHVVPRASLPGDLSNTDIPAVGRDITAMVQWQGRLLVGTLADGLWERVPTSSRPAPSTKTAPWRRVVLDAQGGPALDRRINRLAVGPEGQLWVATARGLGRIDRLGHVRVYGIADGLPASDVHSIWVSPRAGDELRAVVGTARGAVLVLRNGELSPLGGKQGLPVRAVWDIAQTQDGALWLASSWGVYRWHKGSVQRFSVATGHLRDDWVTALTTRGNTVFVGSYRGGVTELRKLEGAATASATSATSAATNGPTAVGVSYAAQWRGGMHINLGGLRVVGDVLWAATMEGALRVALDGEAAARLATTATPATPATPATARGNVTAIAPTAGNAAGGLAFGTRAGLLPATRSAAHEAHGTRSSRTP